MPGLETNKYKQRFVMRKVKKAPHSIMQQLLRMYYIIIPFFVLLTALFFLLWTTILRFL